MALFLPLNILEADITQNPKSDLWNARGFLALEPLGGIRDNLYKNTIALFMSEVLFRTLKDGANEDGLYEWLLGSILALDALESDWSNFHLRFLLELSGALGFRPTTLDLAPFMTSARLTASLPLHSPTPSFFPLMGHSEKK